MSKLIKHEFRASSRQMLIILAVCFCSAILSTLCANNAPNWVVSWLLKIFALSMFLVFIMTFVIVIGRFYRNTMTDTGYLTMTLPISMHQFIWGELITSFLWVLISSAVIVSAGVLCGWISGLMSGEILSHMTVYGKTFFNGLNEYGISVIQMIVLIAEVIVMLCLAFILFCLRFYCAMSVGQLFSKHRGLVAVIVYFIIGSLITTAFYMIMRLFGGVMNLSMQTVEMIITDMGILNIGLAICGAVIYFLTVLILSKKLNLP